jgi:exopolysaccharide biosynthesis polyprenyl glycosylphosphotransferase
MYQPVSSLISNALQTSSNLTSFSYVQPYPYRIDGWQVSAKRAMDVFIAACVLCLIWPVMLAAAIAISLESPGPVMFRQRRIGLGNVGFQMWKFRTMYDHPPQRGRLEQTTRHDPRVTRVGAFLRRTSIDELPQLFNVLTGEMSIVGPRPHAPGTCAGGTPFELVTPYYHARHSVPPGITGLAQVRGLRGETDTEEKLLLRVASDLEYIENWSLWSDIVILMQTVLSTRAMRNAY